MLKVLDLFSGIGGFSLGLERTGGFKTIAFCEIDPFCRAVLRKHWPEVPIYEDVRTLTPPLGFADVICGGFPCQDISKAGRRAGITGERSGLWRHMVDTVRMVGPRYVIVENVAALLGSGLDVVLGDLAAISYDAEWHCIPAGAVGAPHIRERIWIVAYPDSFNDRGNSNDGNVRGSAQASSNQTKGPHRKRHRRGLGDGGQAPHMADADPTRRAYLSWGTAVAKCGRLRAVGDTSGWEAEPPVGRVVDGLPPGLDRWRKRSVERYGNAVVPQIPEIIGRAILAAENVQAQRSATNPLIPPGP